MALAFFFAPVAYSFSVDGGAINSHESVYVSLGCKVFGVGDIYYPFDGVAFGCSFPSSWRIPI